MSQKIPFFPQFATDCWPTEGFYLAATAIIKLNGNLGFTPPAAICFHCLRSVFALEPPRSRDLAPLALPILILGFPPLHAREATHGFSDGTQEGSQGERCGCGADSRGRLEQK